MREWRKSTGLKITALVLALIFGVAGFWSSYVTLANWDDLWSAQGYFSSSHCYNAMERRQNQVRQLVSLRQEEVWSGSATYLQRQEMAQLKARLAADKTNFRFLLRDAENGALLDGNIGGNDLASQVVGFTSGTLELYSGVPEGAPDDSAEKSAIFVIECGVAPQLPVADEFSAGQADYAKTRQWLPAAGLCALLCDGVLLLLLVLLCSAAGHRRGRDGICLTPLDRLPTDLFAGLAVALFALLISAGEGIAWAFQQGITPRVLVGMALISLAVGWLVVAVLLSVCVRIKAHRFWRSCLLWRLCHRVWQGCKTIFGNWSMTGRAVLLFCLYLVGSFLTGFTLIFFLPYQCLVLYALCRWVIQWRAICSGTAAILGGDADYKIPTDHMYPDLKRHAAQLNDLGSAVGSAVDQRMKSERFKAELITNVSHDLKTPLTSIINYVDLLKKIPLENPTADEYIEVLDRKSQRLKKLTEDLVEASKASTGTLAVNRERLGMTQLVGQALGEYEEKFAAKNLEVVSNSPPDDLYVLADGRHLWRVIDNLFSNCAKYAMGGTRLYLDLTRWDGKITFSVKNISTQALNVPPEQLMERFVRGEEARSTEGSGLGLSIARSLTELQGGTFRLAIDGDLFKATITFPEAVAPSAP